jgi:hypothetical protein
MGKPRAVPKKLRQIVWNKYIGEERGIGFCQLCMKAKIDKLDFQCGHKVSVKNGGKTTIDNLFPICTICNQSMGSMNLDEYKSKYLNVPNEEFEHEKISGTIVDLSDVRNVDMGDYRNCVNGSGHLCEYRLCIILLKKYPSNNEFHEDFEKARQKALLVRYSIGVTNNLDDALEYCINNNYGNEIYVLHKTISKSDTERIINEMNDMETNEIKNLERKERRHYIIPSNGIPNGNGYIYAVFK